MLIPGYIKYLPGDKLFQQYIKYIIILIYLFYTLLKMKLIYILW